jgi:hypothetical protein
MPLFKALKKKISHCSKLFETLYDQEPLVRILEFSRESTHTNNAQKSGINNMGRGRTPKGQTYRAEISSQSLPHIERTDKNHVASALNAVDCRIKALPGTFS